MYAAYLQQHFPLDERAGLYAAPNLPAVKLGKLLMKDTRIGSPNDVLAIHLNEGLFSSEAILFTEDRCYHDKGEFLLEDVKEVQQDEDKLTVFVNQKGQFVPHRMDTKSDQVATTLKKVLDGLAAFDPYAEQLIEKTYEGFATNELDWLNLRDQVLYTIDQLYIRYNDGKLSLLEYEDKKAELLGRL
ncbi:MAG: hypothetical protein AAGI38_09310 [Bacteroidota bacterium]